MSMMDLYSAEALLDDRERICLAGYLLLKEHDSKAKIKAYAYSRPSLPQEEPKKLYALATKWFDTPKVQAFLKIWEQKGTMMTEEARVKAKADPIASQQEEEQTSATEEIIREYERLRDEATDVMDKAKITTMIVNARHKNKDEVKEDTRTTRIYLPQRCSECVLYIKEKSKTL